MYCSKCGAGPFQGKFCPKCGTKVPGESTAPAQNAPASASAPDPNGTNIGDSAKAVAAGIGGVVAGAAAGVSSKASDALSTARENRQKRAQNIASGAAYQSAMGAGGLGGGLGARGGAAAALQTAAFGATGIPVDALQYFPYNIKRNRRYFDPGSLRRPIILLVIAVLVFFGLLTSCSSSISGYGSSSTGGWFVLAFIIDIAAILIAGVWIWYLRDAPSDREVDLMYEQIAATGANEAAEKSDLAEDERMLVEPVVLTGPSRDNVPAPAFSRIGKDALTRWSNFQMSTIFCTENQLFYYGCAQSLTALRREVTTMDIYYNEIALVEIKENLGGYGSFVLHTTSGDQFTMAYEAKQQEAVRGLRSLLRDKKARVVVEIFE